MQVLEITELEDGSALIEIELTEKEKNLLIEIGFTTMIKNGMDSCAEKMIDDHINKERE